MKNEGSNSYTKRQKVRRNSKMSDLSNTQFFQVEPRPGFLAGDILEE